MSHEQVASGEVRVIAPEGFLHHAIAENVFAGLVIWPADTFGPDPRPAAGYVSGYVPLFGPPGRRTYDGWHANSSATSPTGYA